MGETIPEPEIYFLPSGKVVPNNPLPALIYRNVLPQPPDRDSAQVLCEGNHWEKRGEWGVIKAPHFHPNTHECYAVFQGTSRICLGRERDPKAKSDEYMTGNGGVEIDVGPGDVIVVPAGVSHFSISSEGDYRYIGVYPEAAPKWRNDLCRGKESIEDLKTEIRGVAIPDHDPVYGQGGPLVSIWRRALG